MSIIYDKFKSFEVLGTKINITVENTSYGINTVAEVNEDYYYLGEEGNNISTAIALWEDINGRPLDAAELKTVFVVNDIEEINFDLYV